MRNFILMSKFSCFDKSCGQTEGKIMQTIPGVLKQTAHKNPDLPAIVDNCTTISYRDLQHQVLKVAAALQAK